MSASDRVIQPTNLVFNVTYKCPLRCSHCCFSSDMAQHGALDGDLMIAAIDDVAAHQQVSRIDFVGGDPFLHPELMLPALERATANGLNASATTSAYWATTAVKARKVLTPLVEAGLDRITISFDDMHAEFLDAKHVVNAYQAARQLGIEVFIAIVVTPGGSIDAACMFDLLGTTPGADPKLLVYETAINSTGRALEGVGEADLKARSALDKVYRGPCPSALRHFSVTPTGKVLPCCGVLPFHEEMAVGDLNVDAMSTAIARAYDNNVMKWIAFEGPIALLCQITADTEQPLKDEDFDGICSACDRLFSSPQLLELMRAHLPEKLPTLVLLEELFTAVDLYRPAAVAQPNVVPA